MKVAIMTDSTACIPKEMREKFNIHMVPLSVVFENVSYREEIDISTEEFYQKMSESNQLPTTTQPSVGLFLEKMEEFSQDYDAVISIHISSELSGTYQAAKTAATIVEGIEVYAYDSELSAMPQGLFALKAVELAKENKSPSEIIEQLDELKTKIRAYFMVDDLTNLQRGGRLSGTQALIGSLLKIKPILHIEDGFILPFEKIRTRKKAINRIMSMLEEDANKGNVSKVVFIHGNDEASAIELRDDFAKKFPDIENMISYFGPVIGTHLGEKSVGISWYIK